MKILIIGDDPDIAEAVSFCFEIRWLNTEILTAPDGETGLGMLKESGAGFVALGLGLPDMNSGRGLPEIM